MTQAIEMNLYKVTVSDSGSWLAVNVAVVGDDEELAIAAAKAATGAVGTMVCRLVGKVIVASGLLAAEVPV